VGTFTRWKARSNNLPGSRKGGQEFFRNSGSSTGRKRVDECGIREGGRKSPNFPLGALSEGGYAGRG